MHRPLTRKASPLSLPSNGQVGTRIRSEHCTLERTSHLLLAWHETCRKLILVAKTTTGPTLPSMMPARHDGSCQESCHLSLDPSHSTTMNGIFPICSPISSHQEGRSLSQEQSQSTERPMPPSVAWSSQTGSSLGLHPPLR